MSDHAERNRAPKPDAPVDWEALVAEMITHPEPEIPFEDTEQGQRELAARPGFTGTLRDYLAWIEEMLMYGSLQLGDAREVEHPVSTDALQHELRLVTGGFSTDESLLHRVRQSFLAIYRESEHRGGLYLYEIPASALESNEVYPWMRPVAADEREASLPLIDEPETQPASSDVEWIVDGCCLLCGDGVLNSGEHLDAARHAGEVARILAGRTTDLNH